MRLFPPLLILCAACSSPTLGTELRGVTNYAEVAPGIARGGQPDGKGLATLKELGYRTIINLRQNHSEKDEAEALGFRVVEIPIHADVLGSTPPTETQIREFFGVVLDRAAQPVFFHCAHGMDRTGTMAALYRIEVDGWTNDAAIDEMLKFGYHTFYKDLIGYVRKYRPLGIKPKAD